MPNYKSYFSSRGVTPEMYEYDKARLPIYILEAIGDDKEKTILDLGCGFGQNIAAFQNEGFKDVSGLDISEEAVAFCRERGFNVTQGDVMQYSGRKYDFVLMSHVLEHLPKDQIIDMLCRIKETVVQRGGTVCLRPQCAIEYRLLLGI